MHRPPMGGEGGDLIAIKAVFFRCTLPNELVIFGVYLGGGFFYILVLLHFMSLGLFKPIPKQE